MPDGLRDSDLQVLEIDVVPAQGEEFTDSEAGRRVEQNQRAFSHGEFGEKSLKFVQFEHIGNPLSFRALTNEFDRVLIRPLVPHRMTKESAHDVPNLRFRTSCPLD